ncbi:MAG TPA: TIGR01212 family radical SAM protein [Sediminispirochaeta sp.]|nr:TIGR01212 family radical SAM protein [Sediminispirochaeta sp.]
MEEPRFFRYSRYLKQKYGQAVYRISVDAGFTCPHRRTDGSGGCGFCDELGSRAAYQEELFEGRSIRVARGTKLSEERLELIRLQIQRGREFLLRRYGAERYILYFQAFTNTFAPPRVLKKIYDYALSQGDFLELIVSTRPDCLSPANVRLLASYRRPNFDVWVELGLQSAHNRTLSRVNRGHSVERFQKAFRLLREAGLKISVHLIFGLPGEGLEETLETIEYLAALGPEAVKIHNVNIPEGTLLSREYLCGEYVPPSDLRHMDYLIEALRRLPPRTVIQRVTCDTAGERREAPLNFMPKGAFYQRLEEKMRSLEIFQGDLSRC